MIRNKSNKANLHKSFAVRLSERENVRKIQWHDKAQRKNKEKREVKMEMDHTLEIGDTWASGL